MHIQGTLPILPVGLVSKHAQNKHEREFIEAGEEEKTKKKKKQLQAGVHSKGHFQKSWKLD